MRSNLPDSVFASDCIFSPTKCGRPPVVVGGPCDALRSGIGMTTNLPGHFISVTQCCLAMNDTQKSCY